MRRLATLLLLAALAGCTPQPLMTYSTDSPSQGLVGHHGDGFQAVFCDGNVRYIPASITAETLNALFTRSGGEVVKLP